jgi:hypothetical protein
MYKKEIDRLEEVEKEWIVNMYEITKRIEEAKE